MTQHSRTLPCEIELPDDWDACSRTVLPETGYEQRRFPRIACQANAALRCSKTFPAIPRTDTWCRVLVQDISRCGTGFLHSEQLFPDEKALIVFPDGNQRAIQVMRCRRLGKKCFEVGCQFIAHESAP